MKRYFIMFHGEGEPPIAAPEALKGWAKKFVMAAFDESDEIETNRILGKKMAHHMLDEIYPEGSHD